ncbi:MAG: exodeoxyribonuclease VII large subunit [Victivallales bacterium]|nr:exodeoxyribonuclease VII large subunit [Victivallales bacterium]
MTEKIWTVSEVNAAVREVIEGGFLPFWLEAEVGTLTVHRSGHVYLSLKDERSAVKGVFFNGAGQIRALGVEVGSKVEAFGNLTVYQVRGEYQYSIKVVKPKGLGDLQRRFDELKRKLESEGFFDPERKKKLPLLPRRIGVVTSPGGAAIRDFLQIIGRRYPDICIRIYPAAVQGKGAERELAHGVRFFNDSGGIDVIIVMRGGGSLEDLWPFNEEMLAREIGRSTIPVISAVGHEVDFTICDFVADLRVPTPSAAAELVVGKQEEFLEEISSFQRRITSALDLHIERIVRRFERAADSPVFREPVYLLRQHQQNLDDLQNRLDRSLDYKIERELSRIERLSSCLNGLNPKSVLDRGYSIILDRATGKPVMSKVPPGTKLKALLAKGEMGMVAEDDMS